MDTQMWCHPLDYPKTIESTSNDVSIQFMTRNDVSSTRTGYRGFRLDYLIESKSSILYCHTVVILA